MVVKGNKLTLNKNSLIVQTGLSSFYKYLIVDKNSKYVGSKVDQVYTMPPAANFEPFGMLA